jgi:hypothetical protein
VLLTVLGSSGGYPSKGRDCSGYLLEEGRRYLWLDAGSGTVRGSSAETRKPLLATRLLDGGRLRSRRAATVDIGWGTKLGRGQSRPGTEVVPGRSERPGLGI